MTEKFSIASIDSGEPADLGDLNQTRFSGQAPTNETGTESGTTTVSTKYI